MDAAQDRNGLALTDQTGDIGSRGPACGTFRLPRRFTRLQRGLLVERLRGTADLDRLAQQFGHAVFIEVDVGDGREKRVDHETVNGFVARPQLGGTVGVLRNPFGGMDQQILQRGDFVRLAANADIGAGGSMGSLFTLIAKHGRTSPFFYEARFWVEKNGHAFVGNQVMRFSPNRVLFSLICGW